MIAPSNRVPAWHKQFLAMMPAIEHYARFAFRSLDPEAREDAIEEVIANALVAFVRLHERGKADLAYPIVLARYAVAQIRDGRRVGMRQNGNDVMSRHAQRKHGFAVEQLDRFEHHDGCWKEALVEDRRSGPAETAAARIDVGDWLTSLPERNREIAKLLATGESTKETAREFGLSEGRISQLRGELRDDWRQFQGGPACCGS